MAPGSVYARNQARQGADHHSQLREVLAREGTRIAALSDGTASIAGTDHRWSMVGLHDISGNDPAFRPVPIADIGKTLGL